MSSVDQRDRLLKNIGSMVLGAFVLLPYLALRRSNPTFMGNPSRMIRLWDSRWVAIAPHRPIAL